MTIFSVAYAIATDSGSDAKSKRDIMVTIPLKDFDNVDQLHKELFPNCERSMQQLMSNL